MEKKVERVLEIYGELLDKRVINKRKYAMAYDVTARTVQRDIDDIRCFFKLYPDLKGKVVYDRDRQGFVLEEA